MAKSTVLPPQRQPKSPSSLNDEGVDMLYQELADAERAHRMEQFWKRFGVLAVAVSALVVIGTAGYVYYRHSVTEAQATATSDFYRIEELLEKGNLEEAASRFGKQAESVDASMRPLLWLRQAEILIDAGKKEEALVVLRRLVEFKPTDAAMRDTARMSIARHTTDPKEMQTMLAAAAVPGAPFAPLAQQMRASLAMAEGNAEEALTALNAASGNEALPPSVKARTEELRAAFVLNQAVNNPNASPGVEVVPGGKKDAISKAASDLVQKTLGSNGNGAPKAQKKDQE